MRKNHRRFRHTQVDIIGGCCALFVLGLAFWFGVRPVLDSDDDVRRLAGQAADSQAQLESAQAEYRHLQDMIEETELQLEKLALELDSSDQLASRQEGIGRVLRNAGVKVEQLTVGAVRPGELLDIVPLRINGTGTSPQVISAMHALRKRFPDLAVTSFQITGGGNAESNEVVYGFDLAWYIASDGSPES